MDNQKLPLMRKATAVWLVENTSLTFGQIAAFCGLHELEVQGIADGDVASGIIGQSPINSGQLTKEEITRCEENPLEVLTLRETVFNNLRSGGRKSGRYTPIARRGDKPDGIAYLLKYYPEITNLQIKKLIGTTDKMIDSIRDRTHWNLKNIKPRDVVLLGLCSQSQFNNIVLKTSDIEGVVEKKKKKSTAKTSKITEKKTAIKKDKVAKTKKKSK
jgi:hypothetical protein